jgi:hypothetical protein
VTGTMLIPNYVGEKTLLRIAEGPDPASPHERMEVASSEPSENVLADANAALKREQRNATVSVGNVKFLTYWLRLYNAQQDRLKSQEDSVPTPAA